MLQENDESQHDEGPSTELHLLLQPQISKTGNRQLANQETVQLLNLPSAQKSLISCKN